MSVEEIEDLIGEYGNILYKFCIKLTQNKEDAEDLYQQTFLKATELRHKINKNSSRYYDGLQVVPIVMMGELFFGIYFNKALEK